MCVSIQCGVCGNTFYEYNCLQECMNTIMLIHCKHCSPLLKYITFIKLFPNDSFPEIKFKLGNIKICKTFSNEILWDLFLDYEYHTVAVSAKHLFEHLKKFKFLTGYLTDSKYL